MRFIDRSLSSISKLFENTELTEFPPKRPLWKWFLLYSAYSTATLGLVVSVEQFIGEGQVIGIKKDPIWVYIGLSFVVFTILFDRFLRNRVILYRERLEDPSEIMALINKAKNVSPRWIENNTEKIDKPEPYEERRKAVIEKIEEIEKIGQYGWSDYRILALELLLVDFENEHDLRTEAQRLLSEIKDYAEGSSYSYDKETYDKWVKNVDDALKEIDEIKRGQDVDVAANKLRAQVRGLLEHVVGYNSLWSDGSVKIRGIMIVGAVLIPIFLFLGLVPFLHPTGSNSLGILNWGFLGIVGALTAVLLALRKTDLVEVGNTEGKKELWRAIIGSVLGLVAGVLVYSIIAGGIITGGAAVPTMECDISSKCKAIGSIALSVLWAVSAGFSFERIFERVRSLTETQG